MAETDDALSAAIRGRLVGHLGTPAADAVSDRELCDRLHQTLYKFSQDNGGHLSNGSIRQACNRVFEGSRPEGEVQALFARWLGISTEEVAALRTRRKKRVDPPLGLVAEEDLFKVANGSSAKIYPSWKEAAEELFPKVVSKVTFIDTWFDEGPLFRPLIGNWKEANPDKRLNFDLYQLSEETPFGAQRLKEIANNSETGWQQFQEQYIKRFQSGVDEASMYLSDLVNLNIYRYDVMPGVRFLVLDENIYIFSWFPLGGLSATNICFAVSVTSMADESDTVAKRLKNQVRGIVDASAPLENQDREA